MPKMLHDSELLNEKGTSKAEQCRVRVDYGGVVHRQVRQSLKNFTSRSSGKIFLSCFWEGGDRFLRHVNVPAFLAKHTSHRTVLTIFGCSQN